MKDHIKPRDRVCENQFQRVAYNFNNYFYKNRKLKPLTSNECDPNFYISELRDDIKEKQK